MVYILYPTVFSRTDSIKPVPGAWRLPFLQLLPDSCVTGAFVFYFFTAEKYRPTIRAISDDGKIHAEIDADDVCEIAADWFFNMSCSRDM